MWSGLTQTCKVFPGKGHGAVCGTKGLNASLESSGGHPPSPVFRWKAHNTSRGLIGNTWRPRCAPLCFNPSAPQMRFWGPGGVSPLHPQPPACPLSSAREGFDGLASNSQIPKQPGSCLTLILILSRASKLNYTHPTTFCHSSLFLIFCMDWRFAGQL